jgi:nucleotide-binding universal stress UspA family protein
MSIKTILHPTDFSEHSLAALKTACSLARGWGARLIMLHVIPNALDILAAEMAAGHEPSQHFEEDIEGYRNEMRQRLDAVGPPFPGVEFERVLKAGHVAPTILRAVQETGSDLIVMGTRGKKGSEQAVMGSVAREVTHRAPCEVLTVRAPLVRRGK